MLTQCSNPSRRCCRSWKLAFLPAAVLCCVLVFGGSGVSLLYAQTPNLSAKEAKREWIYARQAEAWGAFYAGRHQEAMGLAAPLLKAPFEWASVEAMHCQARCYWAMGADNPRHKAAAKAIWDRLEKASTLTANLQRLKIAKALQSETQAKSDKGSAAKDTVAIKLLEGVLADAFPDTCTAEAAIELACIYAESRRFDEAARAYDFATRFLEHQQKLELSPAAAAAFLKAAADGKTNLAYLRDTGRKLFETAEGLRHQGKFAEAIRTYRQVIRMHPQTDYAPRSRLQIGYCLLGIGRVDQALLSWLQLIQDAPSGPWRGQAYLALIDVYLEQRLDIGHAAQYARMARDSLSSALADKTAAASWQPAAFDICLRSGITAFVQGQQQAAAEAFEAALQGAASLPPETRAGMELLLEAARDDKALLPEDVQGTAKAAGGANSQAATALAIGSIYRLSGQLGKAQTFFDRVAPMQQNAPRPAAVKIRPANPAQQAFAIYSLAMIAQASGQTEAALQGYLASLKAYPAGSWHDATLYCVASIIEGRAKAKYGSPASSATIAGVAASTKAKRIKRPSAADRAKAAAAERARLAAYGKARCKALPYWRQLIEGFPESPYAEPAMYNVGVLLYETEQFAEAAEVLNRFVGTYPKSLWAGDAYVKLIDVALERMFNLPAAQSLAARAVPWAKNVRGGTIANTDQLPPDRSAWSVSSAQPSAGLIRYACYSLYLRAGLVFHLNGQSDRASEMFEAGALVDSTERKKFGVETGLERLTKIAQRQVKPLTPEGLLEMVNNDRQKTAVALGDLYLQSFHPTEAGGIYEQIRQGKPPLPKPTAGIEAYVIWRRGQSLEFQKKHDEAIDTLKRLYDKKYQAFPWAADGIYRVGVWSYNHTQDPEVAAPHYRHVFMAHPDHPEAVRALFLYSLNALNAGEVREAIRTSRLYLERYPDTLWANRIRTDILPKAIEKMKGTRK